MSDLTISAAATLTGAQTSSGDLFPLLDISASAGSKGSKITRDELGLAMVATGALSAVVPLTSLIAVGTHTEHTNDGNQSNGSDTTTTSRTKTFITCACGDLQVLLTNIYGSSSPAVNPYSITVKAAIELSGGTVYPLFFNGGSRTAVLAPGAAILTDPLAYRFAAGEHVFVRVNVSVAGGDKWPRWTFISNSVDQFETGSDMTDSGTLTGTNGYSYRASGVYGKPATSNQGSVAVIGDSLAAGAGGNTHYNGFIQRSFGGDYGKSVPHAFIGCPGETVQNFITQSKTVYRLGIIRGCKSALVQLGTNDIFSGRTAAQVQADLATLYARLLTLGITRIYQCTVTPRTTSSDSFATVVNQTTTNAGYESARVTLNTWIRANTAGITGYFEIADLVESARDSGKWIAASTADGIHPTDAMHTTMSAGITTAGLLTVP